ncbi:putative carboxypeptidase [Planotetraspora mira]|uniref:Putative carboxypeptidase n=1 Tax=Planotetraspora mira TaxID=58121 RepID=A0A8J3TTY0_9ACTN|nr:putative carboxypeptidase [Planotetraspora mira]
MTGVPVVSPPRRLRRGDRVVLVAPSGPVDPVRLARGKQVLLDLGLEVGASHRLLDRQGYLAGSDSARAAELQEAWCDPGVAAVICARGGYGATRLLDLLDWDAMGEAEPKILLGSSDITALHRAFAHRLGVSTLFGPMPASATMADEAGPEPMTLAHLKGTLFEGGTSGPVTGTASIGTEGSVTAPVTGGNLTLLAALAGTPYAMRAEGRIVLLEDVSEEPYRIDRMLTQLLQAGCLDGALGFVLGSWVDCGDPLPVLTERLASLGVPIIAGLPIGHGSPQFGVWLETDGVIDTKSCSLTGMFRYPDRAP